MPAPSLMWPGYYATWSPARRLQQLQARARAQYGDEWIEGLCRWLEARPGVMARCVYTLRDLRRYRGDWHMATVTIGEVVVGVVAFGGERPGWISGRLLPEEVAGLGVPLEAQDPAATYCLRVNPTEWAELLECDEQGKPQRQARHLGRVQVEL